MQGCGVLGAALKRPVAWPAGGVDIHRPGESGGGSGGGRGWYARRPTVRRRERGSGGGSLRGGLLAGEAGVGGEDRDGSGAGGASVTSSIMVVRFLALLFFTQINLFSIIFILLHYRCN